jgi:hypothetical protein
VPASAGIGVATGCAQAVVALAAARTANGAYRNRTIKILLGSELRSSVLYGGKKPASLLNRIEPHFSDGEGGSAW